MNDELKACAREGGYGKSVSSLMCNNLLWCSWLGDFVPSAFSANSAVNAI
jgi:hypothetical protein